jgi:hypothetical protein
MKRRVLTRELEVDLSPVIVDHARRLNPAIEFR